MMKWNIQRLSAVWLAGVLLFGLCSSPVCAEESGGTNVIAVILGEPILEKDAEQLTGRIFGALMKKFSEENPMEVTDEDIAAYQKSVDNFTQRKTRKMQARKVKLEQRLKDETLSDKERGKMREELEMVEEILEIWDEIAEMEAEFGMDETRQMEREINHWIISRWKLNRALYEKYGGRVIFQQAGPEPLDAYRDFLKEQEENGAFQILDDRYANQFWNYFTNQHSFYNEEDGRKFMMTPPWELHEEFDDDDEGDNE